MHTYRASKHPFGLSRASSQIRKISIATPVRIYQYMQWHHVITAFQRATSTWQKLPAIHPTPSTHPGTSGVRYLLRPSCGFASLLGGSRQCLLLRPVRTRAAMCIQSRSVRSYRMRIGFDVPSQHHLRRLLWCTFTSDMVSCVNHVGTYHTIALCMLCVCVGVHVGYS